ncbi:MAG: LLM class F420-dependent oxidoreductase [Pseudomonadales bacterium]|nr:LLM class F420-dependent oxidoreductase [Pseudomonadales bacterium]
MKIGFFGINTGVFSTREAIIEVAKTTEDAGYESLWTGEHVVLVDPQSGSSPIPPESNMVDTIASLAFLAGITEKIKLGSGIILLAQRNPVVLAKELAGIDVLSNGRLLFGVGVGYVKEEFDVIGVPFEERGARVTEHIEAIRALWVEDRPSFDGQFTQISGVQSNPRPIQKPHPPIIIGGSSTPAYRRAVKQGNGWYGFYEDVETTAMSIKGLKEAALKYERPAELGELEITMTPPGPVDFDTMRRYEDLGVTRLVLLRGFEDMAAPRTDTGLKATLRHIEETAIALKL